MGSPVLRTRHILDVSNSRVDTDVGPVELAIGDQPFLFGNEGDGETLRISEEGSTSRARGRGLG